MALFLHARAKLNLGLRITGRRQDGYHLLETLYHAIELADQLWAERTASGVTLQLLADDPRAAVGAGADNLVVRVAERFRQRIPAAGGFRFLLHKAIPAAAGLGGGSSDAAAALRLCNALCGEVL